MTDDEERRFAPAASFSREFHDSDAFAASIPGGNFGIVPTDGRQFQGVVRRVNLAGGVSVRSMAASEPIALRSEFVGGSTPTITYFFSPTSQPKATVDGVHLGDATVFSRGHGHTPSLKTGGPFEVAGVCILHESLRRASAALTGRENAKLLLAPSALKQAEKVQLATLQRNYADICRIVEAPHWKSLTESQPNLAFAREEITASLVSVLDTGDLKTDHLAHQLQTTSMRRIDQLIDEHSDKPIGLQELCERSSLSLRTVESIIRRRMDMTAHAYFQRRRLVFARRALLSPQYNTTVTNVAMDHGFTHLGRFSVFYRHIYGESPSETLRRASGRRFPSASSVG